MSDKDLIELVATLWVAFGGDATGFSLLQKDIAEKIIEIKEANEPTNRSPRTD